ncbi:MAG TPA: hypothetical protein PKC30_12310 [Saprospiraceae bacterium]|nr:hypothetical protein [Saprospiraceae bacterium]
MMRRLFLFTVSILVMIALSCTTDIKDIDRLLESFTDDREIAKEVEILYSDSARVKARITAPTMVRHLSRTAPKEEFPNGMFVEFLDSLFQVESWLKSDYAIREVLQKRIITRRNVEMENENGERIMTGELIWDEQKEILYTEKFVKIIQPENQDTTMGFGFITNQAFTRFEIKRRGAASLNSSKFKESEETQ